MKCEIQDCPDNAEPSSAHCPRHRAMYGRDSRLVPHDLLEERVTCIDWLTALMVGEANSPVQARHARHLLGKLFPDAFVPGFCAVSEGSCNECPRWLLNMIRDFWEWPAIARSSVYLWDLLTKADPSVVLSDEALGRELREAWHIYRASFDGPTADRYSGVLARALCTHQGGALASDGALLAELGKHVLAAVDGATTPDQESYGVAEAVLGYRALAAAGAVRSEEDESIAFTVGTSLQEVERRMVRATLRKVGGDKKLCAQLLGIASRTIYRRLESYGETCGRCGSGDALPHLSTLDCRGAARRERDRLQAKIASLTVAPPPPAQTEQAAPSEPRPRPNWTDSKSSKRVWSEDDADVGYPGHEFLEAAFKRIYKKEIPALHDLWDGGDALFKLVREGNLFVVLVASYPGNSEIREISVYSDVKVSPR